MKINSKVSYKGNRNSFWSLCKYDWVKANRIWMTTWWFLNLIKKQAEKCFCANLKENRKLIRVGKIIRTNFKIKNNPQKSKLIRRGSENWIESKNEKSFFKNSNMKLWPSSWLKNTFKYLRSKIEKHWIETKIIRRNQKELKIAFLKAERKLVCWPKIINLFQSRPWKHH